MLALGSTHLVFLGTLLVCKEQIGLLKSFTEHTLNCYIVLQSHAIPIHANRHNFANHLLDVKNIILHVPHKKAVLLSLSTTLRHAILVQGDSFETTLHCINLLYQSLYGDRLP